MIMLSVLLLPAMIIRFYQGWFQMLYIDVPLFLASTFSISSFYLVSQKELFPRTWYADLPLPAVPDGAGHRLDHHQLQGGDRSADRQAVGFARTPKYSVQSKGDQVAGREVPQAPGMVPWIELVIGCYFAR